MWSMKSGRPEAAPLVQTGAHPLSFRDGLFLHVFAHMWASDSWSLCSVGDTEPGSGSRVATVGFEDTQLTCRHLGESFQLWI